MKYLTNKSVFEFELQAGQAYYFPGDKKLTTDKIEAQSKAVSECGIADGLAILPRIQIIDNKGALVTLLANKVNMNQIQIAGVIER